MPRSLSKNEIANFRNQLCVAAESLYETKGTAGVTMRELAQAMHVSAMTPYRYFRDKNEIFACLQTQALQQFVRFLRKTCETNISFIFSAESKAKAYVAFRNAHPRLYRLMFEDSAPRDFPFLAEARAQATEAMALQPAADNTQAHADISQLLWASLHGACTMEDIGVLQEKAELTDFCIKLSRVMTRGYLCRKDLPAELQAADSKPRITEEALNNAP